MSLTYEFTFISANTEPTNNNLETISDGLYSIENMIINISEENISIRSNDTNDFSHDVKNCLVDSLAMHKIVKGERSTNTFIKMYLTENINIKFKNPTDTIVLIIPSIEKKL